jgi:hypothetical protein
MTTFTITAAGDMACCSTNRYLAIMAAGATSGTEVTVVNLGIQPASAAMTLIAIGRCCNMARRLPRSEYRTIL